MSSEEERQAYLMQQADQLGRNDLMIGDGLELVYKFIFDPKSDFREITKLWSITNLTKDDVRRIIDIAKVIRILDNKKFYRETTKKRATGKYKEFLNKNTDQVIKKAVYQEIQLRESRFEDRLIQKYMGEIQSICAAAGGRDASIIRAFRTATHQQQVDQRSTQETKGWGWKK